MIILHLSMETCWGGGEKQLTLLAAGCIKQGHSAYVVCRESSKVQQHCLANDLPMLTLSQTMLLPRVLELRRLCRIHKADILHLHDSRAHTLAVLTHLTGIKAALILTRRMALPIKNNCFSRFKYNYPGIRRIICVSDMILRSMRSRLRHPDRLLRIYGMIDRTCQTQPDFVENQYPQTKGKLKIGFVGSLVPVKNPELFIEMSTLLSSVIPEAFFILAGEGPLLKRLSQFIGERDLNSRFIFTGFVSENQSLISSLSLLVIPSLSEGIPNVILEAQSLNIPVVATAVGGIPEVITHEHTGLLIYDHSPVSLAKAAERLLLDTHLKKHIVIQAQAQLHRFDETQALSAHLQVYKEAMRD